MRQEELHGGYSPTERLKFENGILLQEWVSCYEEEEPQWIVVKGQ